MILRMFWRLDPPDPQIWRVKASGCCRLFGDNLGHRPVVPERPAFSNWDVSGGHRGFDFSPSAVRGETDHSIPNPGAGAAALACRVRIRRRADRNPSSGRRVPRQRSRAITPVVTAVAGWVSMAATRKRSWKHRIMRRQVLRINTSLRFGWVGFYSVTTERA